MPIPSYSPTPADESPANYGGSKAGKIGGGILMAALTVTAFYQSRRLFHDDHDWNDITAAILAVWGGSMAIGTLLVFAYPDYDEQNNTDDKNEKE